jgi:L-2-hydroxyglutarate oxidase LhgO
MFSTRSSQVHEEATHMQDAAGQQTVATHGFSAGLAPQRDRYDIAIVGGGIVGLATARELLLRQPRLRLIVVEKDATIASQQSGHNSGVLHTGIYYAPGSLKAQACVEGHLRMLRFCEEQDIAYELCGKLIVALDESELPRLNELYRRGTANGVVGLELVGPERLCEIDPYAAGIKAIYSPNTGIVDFVKVAHAYARSVQAQGGEIVVGHRVTAITQRGDTALLTTRTSAAGQAGPEIAARWVITCAGLHSDQVSAFGHGQRDVRILPFRGDYYVLRPEKRQLVRALIYPVPDPRFPFLGVHFTRRHDGEIWAGPNAVLAFARQGYGRWDIAPGDLWDALSYGGFWKMAARYWRVGMAEYYRDYVKRAYVNELQRYVPALRADDLLPGPSGVRAQAVAPDGRLVDDFLIRRGERTIHVQNAPSPAATSSLVIASFIVETAEKAFDLSA